MDTSENTLVSQKKVTKVQVLPNPAAQFPSALPPLLVHSELEKHVPNTVCVDVEDDPEHWSLGNVTTENNENCSETPQKKKKGKYCCIKKGQLC